MLSGVNISNLSQSSFKENSRIMAQYIVCPAEEGESFLLRQFDDSRRRSHRSPNHRSKGSNFHSLLNLRITLYSIWKPLKPQISIYSRPGIQGGSLAGTL